MSSVAAVDPPRSTHPATRAQLAWLTAQLEAWQAEGLLDGPQVARIAGRYHADHRFPLARLLLTVGAGFVGVGLIWLVAANIAGVAPGVRILVVALLWLGFLVGAEVLATRSERPGAGSSPVVGAVRLMASLAFGAVVFQAAQSLQVPAYEPALVGWWALGALLHAYAVRGVMPLVVAIVTGSVWIGWQVLPDSESWMSLVLCLVTVGVVGIGAAAAHSRWAAELSEPWRETGAAFVLTGLFVAALPLVDADGFDWTTTLVGMLIAAGVIAAVGLGAASMEDRYEVLGAGGAGLAAVALVLWDTSDHDVVTGPDLAHAAISVAVYVVAAVGVAVVGAMRDSWRLTALATGALVLFTTVQSFAVFARILEGAWLFVALGVIFLGTGFVFDRARRRLVAAVTDDEGATR